MSVHLKEACEELQLALPFPCDVLMPYLQSPAKRETLHSTHFIPLRGLIILNPLILWFHTVITGKLS